MEPAVTTVLDWAFVSSNRTAWDVLGNSHELCEVSNRAGSPFLGCRWSPQQVESLAAAGGSF